MMKEKEIEVTTPAMLFMVTGTKRQRLYVPVVACMAANERYDPIRVRVRLPWGKIELSVSAFDLNELDGRPFSNSEFRKKFYAVDEASERAAKGAAKRAARGKR
jgi:hypothetical protein